MASNTVTFFVQCPKGHLVPYTRRRAEVVKDMTEAQLWIECQDCNNKSYHVTDPVELKRVKEALDKK